MAVNSEKKRTQDRRKPPRLVCVAILLILTAAAVAGYFIFCRGVDSYSVSGFAMDSPVSLTIYGGSEKEAQQLLNRVSALENQISATVPSSKVAQLNSKGKLSGGAVAVSDILKKIIPVSIETGGLFDPCCGNLVKLWNITGENPRVPSEKEIKAAVGKTGYTNITLNSSSVALKNGVQLDLGAVGKGAACDDILAQLEKNGCPAVVSVGGSILVYGQKQGSDWTVAVKDPLNTARNMCEISLKGTHNISTSGAYERYFEKDGKKYHHILNPKTGYPAESDILSVTVVAESGTLADALSTACFLVGSEKSAALLELFSADAVIVKNDKTVTVTKNLSTSVKLTGSGYTLSSAEKADE